MNRTTISLAALQVRAAQLLLLAGAALWASHADAVPPVGCSAAARLENLSTRMQVLTGDNVMIGGFIIQGNGPQTVVVRARGPSLTALGG